MGRVNVTVLGQLSVSVDGKPLDLGKPRAQLVLAHLLSRDDRRLRRDELIERVWPDGDPARAKHSLNVHISELRKRLPSEHGIVLQTTSDGYAVALPDGSLDWDRFVGLIQRGDLAGALDTWTGRAFEGLSDQPGVDRAAAALETTRRETLAAWAQAEIADGRFDGLVSRLESALEVDPYDERLCGLLMKAHYAAGAPAKALATYQSIRRRLDEELGVIPGPELQDLEEQILLHDSRLPGRPGSPETRLPAERTPLIGRDLDLAGVLQRLEDARIVSIVGPGGAGKTTLALRAAHLLAERDRDVFFADLSSVTEPDQVARTFVAAIGVSDTRGSSSVDVLRRSLGGHPTVFVVDNCEHLIAAAAALMDQMASWDAELRILATSREPLAIRGEAIWQLEPLEVPPGEDTAEAGKFDAVALFVRRAEAVVAGFDAETHLNAIASLVRRLDGLPLAIELAAALLSSMRPDEIERALSEGIAILDNSHRVAPTRHRSLEETIAWSERLMSSEERMALRRLSVFAGRFGIDSASAVCGFGEIEPPHVRRLLARLVEKSMVVADTTPAETSFHLLETVRAVARTRLEAAGEMAETVERYLDVYGTGAREFGWLASSERRDEALRWARREFDNIADAVNRHFAAGEVERALTIASSLARPITALGRYRTVVDWIERALSTPGLTSVDPHVTAQAQVVFAMAGAEREGSISAGESAYDRFVGSGIHAGAARAAYALAYNASLRGELESARRWSELAVEQARVSGSASTLAWVLPVNVVYRLAVPQRDVSAAEIDEAITDLDEVDALVEQIDNAELPISSAIGRIAVRMLSNDSDPVRGIELQRWVSDTPYYLPVAFDMMRAAAALATNDIEAARVLLIETAESQQDSFQLPARRAMLKVYAACSVMLRQWELAAQLFASAGDTERVLVYGMFFDPSPYHRELVEHLDDRPQIAVGDALDVDDALDLFVEAVQRLSPE